VRALRLLVIALILGLVGLPATAAASPPDPVWLPGLYDLADYDDVVSALLDLEGVRVAGPAIQRRPTRVVFIVVPLPVPAQPGYHVASPESRAPPQF
jgi:hypothetical protein